MPDWYKPEIIKLLEAGYTHACSKKDGGFACIEKRIYDFRAIEDADNLLRTGKYSKFKDFSTLLAAVAYLEYVSTGCISFINVGKVSRWTITGSSGS